MYPRGSAHPACGQAVLQAAALPSSMPQAAGDTELQTQVPSLSPSAVLGPHQGA